MIRRTRWLALTSLSVAYVGWAGIRHAPDGRSRFLGLTVLLVTFGYGWTHAGTPPEEGGHAEPRVRSATRGSLWGAALVAASLLGTADSFGILTASVVGAGIACATALLALAQIPPSGGLLDAAPRARWLHVSHLCLVIGALTALAPMIRGVGRAAGALDDATVQALATSGCLSQILLVAAMARNWSKSRQLEIGIHERIAAARNIAYAALLVGSVAALIAPAGTEARVVALASALAAVGICVCVIARDPVRVRTIQRLALAVLAIGVPVGAALSSVSFRAPDMAPAATGAAMGCGILVGVLAAPIATQLDAVAVRTLRALRSSQAQAQRLDPDEALTGALMALRDLSGASAASAELWCTDPPELITVDRAGYAHHTPCVAPPEGLIGLVELEPERTLQTAVVESVQVRRPDVRPALAWLEQREAFTATVVDDGQFVLGLLLLPALERHLPLTLEEARALHELADRLASILSARSALARSRTRELLTRQHTDGLENRIRELQSQIADRTARHEVLSHHLARPALTANYSSASLLALDEIREAGRTAERALLVTPPGLDPAPFAAVMHLSGPRAAEPLIIVDADELPDVPRPTSGESGVSADDAKPGALRGEAPLDPVFAAAGGSLLVLASGALSHGQQRALLAALERLQSDGRKAPTTILAVPAPVAQLVDEGRFLEEFACQFADRSVALPPLAARPEDLRGILLDRIARIGLRVRGRPLGLDAGALERLIEHTWPANDAEVDDVLTRAALSAPRDVLTAAVLTQIGFLPIPWKSAEDRADGPPGVAPAT